jgi:hypothetical protein
LEDYEELILDARALFQSFKNTRCNGIPPRYDPHTRALAWVGNTDTGGSYEALRTAHIRPLYEYGGELTRVSPVSVQLAGMFFVQIDPQDPRICHGVELAELQLRLEELFPQLRVVFHYGIQFRVDPVTQGYWEKIKPLLPEWAQNNANWRFPAGTCAVYDEGLNEYEMGAYRWEVTKHI